jgi:pSer/pThr/pTyr-binding forkhead associated (FHA) protein
MVFRKNRRSDKEEESMQESDIIQLVMESGPQPGQIFELSRGTISIGRDPGNQVVIDDPQVSRQHARITPQGGLMVLEDLGSTNGTTVNGLRISAPHTLAHGDEIGFGDDVVLTFQGWPSSDSGKTVATPRVTYTSRPPATPRSTYAPSATPAYQETELPGSQSSEADYAAPGDLGYEEYPEYYEEYPEEAPRSWSLYGLGCILVLIIIGLLVAIFVYFFAPASVVDPIADFLAGLGINVP